MEAKRIAVVGAGPAGMMGAIRAAQLSHDVILVEKNPTLGKKLLLSGKGRCNLTNACELDSFLKRFSGNSQFLRDAFKKFFYQELIAFFENRGLRLETTRQLRVFPVSNRASSVIEVLKKELQKNKVEIVLNASIKDIVIKDRKVRGFLLANATFMPADRIILATGGVSYGFTGSTGDGIRIAGHLGHSIAPLKPGLIPLETRQGYPKLLENLLLKNIRLKFSDGQRQIISQIGELLFTRLGIAGALVLSLSGQIVDWLNEDKHLYVEIDLKSALSKEQLNLRLLREFKLNSQKNIRVILLSLLPRKLVDVFIDITKIPSHKKVSQITLEERYRIVTLLKSFRLDISKARPIEEAMITRGGVSLRDINPRTMESRFIRGLYFAGEMIDIDADTGGFNLQAAFSTGYLAGESAALS